MKRIAVLVSGNGSNLQALLDSDVKEHIRLVLSNKPEAFGLQRAEKAGVNTQVLQVKEFPDRDSFDRRLAQILNDEQIDLVVLAGWMLILGPSFLNEFQGETINLHPALPDTYPGLRAIERAFEDGVEKTGCMVHRVTLEVDVGEVLGTREVTLAPNETLPGLEERMHRAEHRLLVEVVSRLIHSS
jgi:phosphoribosylglycinamide formyltransferase-1